MIKWIAMLASTALTVTGVAAQGLAPAGSKGVLTVDYIYDHTGEALGKERQDRWRVKRSVQIEALVVAEKPASAPTLQPLDAQQLGKIERQRAEVDKLTQQMAPAMGDVQALMTKCGDNQACIERETSKMALAMSAQQRGPAADQAQGREIRAVMQQDAKQYQLWRAVSQRGRYAIDETLQSKVVDPLCHKMPGMLCTHDTVRKGGGELPAGAAGIGAVEVDLRTNKLALRLPIPAGAMAYTQTDSTDEPLPSGKPPAPKTAIRQFVLRTTADGKAMSGKSHVVPLVGAWADQSGEQVITLPGNGAEGGKLLVRWRFNAR